VITMLRRPFVGRMLASALLGRLPTGMVALALVLFTRDSGGEFGTAGLLGAGFAAGTAIGGPALARLIDRTGQGVTLVVGAMVSSAALGLLPILPAPLHLVAAVVAGVATPPLEPALRLLWPLALPDDEVPRAYALDAAAQELVFVLGPLLVLAGTALFGPGGGLWCAAALCVAGTLWFVTGAMSREWTPHPHEGQRHWAGPLTSGRLIGLYGIVLLTGLAVGVPAVAFVAYAEGVSDRGLGGWLVTANALGAFIGGVSYSARASHWNPDVALPPLLAGMAVCFAPAALLPPVPAMVPAAVLSGICLPGVLTCIFQLVDRLAPAGTVTEAFAWLISAFLIGSSIGSAVAGALAGHGNISGPFWIAVASVGLGAMSARLLVAGLPATQIGERSH
jgi:MFS family permease